MGALQPQPKTTLVQSKAVRKPLVAITLGIDVLQQNGQNSALANKTAYRVSPSVHRPKGGGRWSWLNQL